MESFKKCNTPFLDAEYSRFKVLIVHFLTSVKKADGRTSALASHLNFLRVCFTFSNFCFNSIPIFVRVFLWYWKFFLIYLERSHILNGYCNKCKPVYRFQTTISTNFQILYNNSSCREAENDARDGERKNWRFPANTRSTRSVRQGVQHLRVSFVWRLCNNCGTYVNTGYIANKYKRKVVTKLLRKWKILMFQADYIRQGFAYKPFC